jgi:hypothetical protein
MGSWSVYCGISNIAITAGRKCVFLPLKKVESESFSYLPYLPATLPIFGEYDDYGGIENIELNDNTETIEKYFNCSIEDFCHFFTRGCIRDDEEDFPTFLKKNREMKKWTFMFIDRQVYDYMSSNVTDGFAGKGHLDFGNPKLLELLGFKYNGEKVKNPTYDPKRFYHEWEYNGEKFYSDGRWLQHEKNSIYYFNSKYSDECCLTHYIKIPEDKMWIGEKAMWQLWEHMDKHFHREHLFWILGKDRSSSIYDDMEEYFKEVNEKLSPEVKKKIAQQSKPKNLTDIYTKDVSRFGKLICDLVTIRFNLHPMSGYFAPYINYLTPQCGEHKQHQELLDKFSEINRSYIDPEADEE